MSKVSMGMCKVDSIYNIICAAVMMCVNVTCSDGWFGVKSLSCGGGAQE